MHNGGRQSLAGALRLNPVVATLRIKPDSALNLPFSEWAAMFPSARLCKAMVDRLADQAHIIETGTESYRLLRTMKLKKAKGSTR